MSRLPRVGSFAQDGTRPHRKDRNSRAAVSRVRITAETSWLGAMLYRGGVSGQFGSSKSCPTRTVPPRLNRPHTALYPRRQEHTENPKVLRGSYPARA